METPLLAAVLVVLVVVAWELSILIRRFDSLPDRNRKQNQGEGATIQVNVGTLPPGVSTTTVTTPPPASTDPVPETKQDPQEAAEPPESEPEPPEPPPRPRQALTPRRTDTTPNGLGIVKCPQCGTENSNFRRECFRCEAKL